MNDLMKIEQIRDLVASAETPSEAVDAVERFLTENRNSYEVIHSTVWLLVIDHFKLRLRKACK